ncbi:MAG: ParB N-terminal domain-containing protein [Hyphomicrobiales bacterium]|nr:ParB N-terminal domain-containing protein [Hyphomicrobiales bacterium]
MTSDGYEVVIADRDRLLPSEHVFAERVDWLTAKITTDGLWTAPVPVDRDTGLIMDGNHRYIAAGALGLAQIPVIPLPYDDWRVTVVCYDDPGVYFDLDRLRQLARSGGLLPPKTTRHLFNPQLPSTDIPLDRLRPAGDDAL